MRRAPAGPLICSLQPRGSHEDQHRQAVQDLCRGAGAGRARGREVVAPKKKTIQEYEAEAQRQSNGCWLHKTHAIARKLYIMRHGELPSTVAVCHTCDTPQCIEDSHHFPGTWGDNVRDSVRKGRHSCFRKGGARNTKPHSEEAKKAIGEASRKMWAQPGRREALREALAKYWTPERRAARAEQSRLQAPATWAKRRARKL